MKNMIKDIWIERENGDDCLLSWNGPGWYAPYNTGKYTDYSRLSGDWDSDGFAPDGEPVWNRGNDGRGTAVYLAAPEDF